jgi:dihydrofolate synthase/folylpolyglutamate synthase
MGQYLGHDEDGIRMSLGRYGELKLALHGRYQIANATLAVQGAGNMHARLPGIPHGSTQYIEAIRAGLAQVVWPGRLQMLQESPAVYLDGAINATSARSLIESLEDRLSDPVIAIVCVPEDKDYAGVYRELGLPCDMLILTETERNITLHFPPHNVALETAYQYNDNAVFSPTLRSAVDLAMQRAGKNGTILIVGTQSIIADAIQLWGMSYEVI